MKHRHASVIPAPVPAFARRAVPAVLAVLATLAMSGRAEAQQNRSGRRIFGGTAHVDTTFAFDKSGTLELTLANGDIHVTGSTDGRMHVHATSEDDNVRFYASSDRVTLDLNGARGGDARFEVAVPLGVRVTARTQSGDISVHGTHGEVEARAQSGDVDLADVTSHLDANTFSGNITASNVTGDLSITTLSGDLKLSDLRGDADVTTVSGDIELRGVTSKDVRAKTTSGDVTFDGLIDPAGRYDLTSHSGDIRLHIQRDASAQLTIETFSGSVDSEFPITLKPGEHSIGIASSKRFTFGIGGGAARISADTFNGDITISANGHGAK